MRDYLLTVDEAIEPSLAPLVATWQDGTWEWRENLGSPPIEAIIWQPFARGPSIGGLILHMISADMHWLSDFVAGVPLDDRDPAVAYDRELDQYGPDWPTPPAEPIEWYFAHQDRVRAQMIGLIRAHGQPFARFPRRGSECTYQWIVAHLVEHDSYTGGQAVLLHEMWKKQVPVENRDV